MRQGNRGQTRGRWVAQVATLVSALAWALLLPACEGSRRVERGEAGQAERHFEETIAQFDQALLLNPEDARTYYDRGFAHLNLGRYQSASGGPEDSGSHTWKAVQDFNQALRLNPDYTEAYYGHGQANAVLGRYQEAIQDYDQVVRLSPQDAVAYSQRGAAYVELGQHQRAIQDYDEALRLNPRFASTYAARAVASAIGGTGADEQARQDVETAVALGYDRATLELAIELARQRWR